MIAVIFDLDETLVDTTPAIAELETKNWDAAERHISEFSLYEGIPELLAFLQKHDIRFAVVSTSPASYCRVVLKHLGIECQCIVGKEEGVKPSPEPMAKVLASLNVEPQQAISFGDKAKDIEAARRAGIQSIACTWGSPEIEKLLNSNPDFVIKRPEEGIQVLSHRFML